VDGEFAVLVFILILLDPAVGTWNSAPFGAIKFQNASGETNGGIASPEEKEWEMAARGQKRERLDVPLLATNPEAAVPCPGAITITEERGEAEDEDGLRQKHKISAADRACAWRLPKWSKSPLW
jgi:hypothetical protein